VRALSLLEGRSTPLGEPAWVSHLGEAWARDLVGIRRLYPQLNRSAVGGGWSCPYRAVAFVGGSRTDFAPIVPNPIQAGLLYNRSGVHPLIASQSVFDQLGTYETTTGACFYPVVGGKIQRPVHVPDASACSLQGVTHTLMAQEWALSSVESSFDARCGSVIDTPDMGGTLRSGEVRAPLRLSHSAALRLTFFL
jgi:hypothetical protein